MTFIETYTAKNDLCARRSRRPVDTNVTSDCARKYLFYITEATRPANLI